MTLPLYDFFHFLDLKLVILGTLISPSAPGIDLLPSSIVFLGGFATFDLLLHPNIRSAFFPYRIFFSLFGPKKDDEP